MHNFSLWQHETRPLLFHTLTQTATRQMWSTAWLHPVCVLASALSSQRSLSELGLVMVDCRDLNLKLWIIRLREITDSIPFFQQPSPAPIPTSPSGWWGPALCCCLDPRASSWAAGDPCSTAPDTAPLLPPGQNTTPARQHTQWHEEKDAFIKQTKLQWKAALLSAAFRVYAMNLSGVSPNRVQKWWKNEAQWSTQRL